MSNRARIFRSRIFHILNKIFMMLGCTIFFFAILFPYHHFMFIMDPGLVPIDVPRQYVDMWSFKVTVNTIFYNYPAEVRDYRLYDNWLYRNIPELLLINIVIFIAQILTLVIGVASVFIDKKALTFAPLVLSFAITQLMLNARGTPLWGYYLTSLSIIPFLAAFIRELLPSRRIRCAEIQEL